ncbi:MAG: acyltransferase [Sphingobacteriaceae bacterium]|nr:acyltransferase [Sphingobacteriaceae bacterium]
MKHENSFLWLDLVRGLAALSVFTGHLRIICFKELTFSESGLFTKLFYFLTGYGHQAIIIFFVLSGFFIIKSIDESARANKWSFSKYSINRLSRLWTVLIPALLVGFIIDKLGYNFFSDSLGYTEQIKYFEGLNARESLNPSVFMGNVFFLQTILVPTLGFNTPTWILPFEFWYYVLFPVLYFIVYPKYSLLIKVLFSLLAIAVFIFVGSEIAIYFLVWLMGGVSYIIYKRLSRGFIFPNFLKFFILLVFGIVLVMIRLKQNPLFFNDYTLGFIFALLIPVLSTWKIKTPIFKKFATYLSNLSYTLYLTHLPLCMFVTSWLSFQVMESNAKNFVIYIALCLFILLYSTLFWYLFERNTDKVKRWIFSLYSKS